MSATRGGNHGKATDRPDDGKIGETTTLRNSKATTVQTPVATGRPVDTTKPSLEGQTTNSSRHGNGTSFRHQSSTHNFENVDVDASDEPSETDGGDGKHEYPSQSSNYVPNRPPRL